MYRHGLRKRPVAEVAAEYASFKGKVIIFWDDNIAGDVEYARSCFAPSRLIENGGAARQVSRLAGMTSSWKRQPSVDANSCSWGWSLSPSPAWLKCIRGSIGWKSMPGLLNEFMATG